MPTDMLDRLQEGKLRALQELIQAWGDAATTGRGEDELAAIADFLVDDGIGVRQGCLHLWDYYLAMALSGKIPDHDARGAKLRCLLEQAGPALLEAAATARAIADRAGRDVARLGSFEDQAKAFPAWVEECLLYWEMLNQPRKPLDHERVSRSVAAFHSGEGEDVGEILARVKAGGPLIKE